MMTKTWVNMKVTLKRSEKEVQYTQFSYRVSAQECEKRVVLLFHEHQSNKRLNRKKKGCDNNLTAGHGEL